MNILSIDLDFLIDNMEEVQAVFDVDLTPGESWSKVHNAGVIPAYSLHALEQCLRIVLKHCKYARTVLINEHDEIYDYLANDSKVWNLDNHHDLGYLGDDDILTIENWAKLGLKEGLISEYHWIARPDSLCPVEDISYDLKVLDTNTEFGMPSFDLVVVCISKHFTPPAYWHYADLIIETIEEQRFSPCAQPEIMPTDYPEYAGDCESISTWYKYKDYYIEDELIEGISWLSIICLGTPDNVLTQIYKFCYEILQDHPIGFLWETGYKSEVLIRRLAKSLSNQDSPFFYGKVEEENKEYIMLGGIEWQEQYVELLEESVEQSVE